MKIAIVVFPGSNCDRDLAHAISSQTRYSCKMIWHKDNVLPEGLDLLFIPGGFSFGDYLRAGAIAANSPIMSSIIKFADRGGYIIGICNGFQILTETGLLKGSLLRNASLNFVCKQQSLIVSNSDSILTSCFSAGQSITLPIAHHDGNYFVERETLDSLEGNGQVLLRYDGNPNGSKNDIAGVISENRRIIGLMPHPERAIDNDYGSSSGSKIFSSLESNF